MYSTFFYDLHTFQKKKKQWEISTKNERERVLIVECNEKDLHNACAIILTFCCSWIRHKAFLLKVSFLLVLLCNAYSNRHRRMTNWDDFYVLFDINIHKTVAIKYHCFPFERIFSFIILEIPKNFQKLLYGNFKKTFNGFIFMSWYLKNIMFLRDGYSMFQMTSFSTWVFFFNFSFASFIINVRFFPWKENKIKINI